MEDGGGQLGAGRACLAAGEQGMPAADAVLAASIFHFGEISIRRAKEAMREAGIEVRL